MPRDWPGHLVPNFSDWLPGDVLLVAQSGGKGLGPVKAWQTLAFEQQVRAAADFTHAALYVGDGLLIDVRPGEGVARRSVWYYAQQRALMLRRLKPGDPGRPPAQRIAECATGHLGKGYSRMQVALSAALPSTPSDPDKLFCSSFIDVVVAEATGVKLNMLPRHRPFFPAVLAVHEELDTVALEWCALGTGRAINPAAR